MKLIIEIPDNLYNLMKESDNIAIAKFVEMLEILRTYYEVTDETDN